MALDFSFNRYMVECEYVILFLKSFDFFGFNRYMVECEFFTANDVDHALHVLIDTWWNVNKEGIAFSEYIGSVLIDTWWNVN